MFQFGNSKMPAVRASHQSAALGTTVLCVLSVCNRHASLGHPQEVGDSVTPQVQVEKLRHGAGETTCRGLTVM